MAFSSLPTCAQGDSLSRDSSVAREDSATVVTHKKKKNIYICTSVSIPPQKRPRISYSIEKREDFWHLMETPRKVIDCNGGVKKND